MMDKGSFREDLYYRLNVISIDIPPLRSRREDIPALARQIVQNHCEQHNLNKKLSPEVMDALANYTYPGNIRELKNLLESMMVVSEGESITLADAPGELRQGPRSQRDPLSEKTGFKQAVREFELNLIQNAVSRYGSVPTRPRPWGCIRPPFGASLPRTRAWRNHRAGGIAVLAAHTPRWSRYFLLAFASKTGRC